MFGRLFAALICAMSLSAIGQTSQPDYQRGTITAVTAHQNTSGESSRDVVRYDVSVKVGNTNYVVLFTPPNGSNTVEYSAGTDMLFLVGANTSLLTVRSLEKPKCRFCGGKRSRLGAALISPVHRGNTSAKATESI